MRKQEVRKDKFNRDCEWLFTNLIYHRGKFNNIDVYENTMMAYKKAMEENCAIELDVQLTNDYQVICFHDNNLKRLFNRDRLVSDITYKRINKLREDLQVPLLKDVLKLIDNKVGIMVELKSSNRKLNNILVEKVYEILKEYEGRYVIASFNPFLLSAYKSLDKEAYIGRIGSNLVNGFVSKLVVKKNYFNFLVKPDFISYDIDNYDENRLEKFKKKGYRLIGWSLKDKSRQKDLKKYYDNFIIEDHE